MRRLLKKLLNYWRKKRERKAFLKKCGFKIVYKRDTSIVLGCFDTTLPKKNGKVDLLDENTGNVLKKDIPAEDASKYMKEYEDAAKKAGMEVDEYLKLAVKYDNFRKIIIFFGKNKVQKFRKHAEQLRKSARKWKVDIPKKVARDETQKVIEEFLQKIITEGKNGVYPYMTLGDCIYTKLDDAILIRKLNGEFVTFLQYSLGGQAKKWDYIKIII